MREISSWKEDIWTGNRDGEQGILRSPDVFSVGKDKYTSTVEYKKGDQMSLEVDQTSCSQKVFRFQ